MPETTLSQDQIIELIDQMIDEYGIMECRNNHPNPYDEETQLYRTGYYGALALEDLMKRIQNNQGNI